jgi:O-antigen/teichoic acid export membrane protein
MKKSIKDLLIYIIIGGASRFVPFVFYPIVLLFYTQEQFGYFTLFNLYLALGSAITLLGIDQALFRFLPTAAPSEQKQLSQSASFSVYITLFFFILFSIFKPYLEPILFSESISGKSIWLFPLIILINISTILLTELKANKKTDRFLYLNILKIFIYIASFLFLLKLGYRLNAFLIAVALSETSTILFSFKSVKNLLSFPRIKTLKKTLKYGFSLTVVLLLNLLLYQTDHYLIKYFYNIETLGIYHFGYKFAAIGGIFVILSNNAWVARFFERGEPFAKQTFNDYSLAVFFINSFIFIVLFIFLQFWKIRLSNDHYWDSLQVYFILGIGYIFYSQYHILDNYLLYSKKTLHLIALSIVILTLNIIFNIIYIPHYGIFAAAYITSGSFVLQWGIIFIYLLFQKKYYIVKPQAFFILFTGFLIAVIKYANPLAGLVMLIPAVYFFVKTDYFRSIFN